MIEIAKKNTTTVKKIILCIDDEVTILNALKTELKAIFTKEYMIEVAESGMEAIELVDELLADGYELALIISDYLMPEMKGDETLKHIHLKAPDAIKIMLTGQATIEGVANAIKYARLYRYMFKPWEREDFKLTVTEAMNRYSRDHHLAEKTIALDRLTVQQTELIQKLHGKEMHLQELNLSLQTALETESKLREIASRFVPNEFLALLGCNNLIDIRLGDAKERKMTVLFCDIRDFTTLCENLTPEQNFKFINSYLSQMEPVITHHGGFIDKYIGDAIMALFSGDADDAVNAAIAMLRRLDIYNGYRNNSGYRPIKIGIGLNTGTLILGTVGVEKRMDGTVISDAVNLSARIENLTKNYSTPLLITHHTYRALKNPNEYAIRMIDTVKVKGKNEDVTVYEVFDADPEETKTAKLATLELFTQAITHYHQKNSDKAQQLFKKCLDMNPQDTVSKIYLARLCPDIVQAMFNP